MPARRLVRRVVYLLAIATSAFAATDARRAERLAGEITGTEPWGVTPSAVTDLIAETAVAPVRRPG
jgi:hypothetical protein